MRCGVGAFTGIVSDQENSYTNDSYTPIVYEGYRPIWLVATGWSGLGDLERHGRFSGMVVVVRHHSAGHGGALH